MQTIGKLALAASAIFWVSAAVAQDDDTTVTRHSEHYDSHHGGAYVGVPGVVGVHVGRDGPSTGCETRSKTVHNEDTGETHTRTATNC